MNKQLLFLLSILLVALPETVEARHRRRFVAEHRISRTPDEVEIYQQPGPYYRDILEHEKELEKEVKELRVENGRLKRQARRSGRGERRRRRKH